MTDETISPGDSFGRWTVLERHDRYHWLCRCECGTRKPVNQWNLESGMSQSCGCVNRSHDMTGTPEYHVWRHMRYRCHDENHAAYPDYGGRGISVCKPWRDSFQAFYDDMGEKPSDSHWLDRIDNDGDYTPENCRWVTPRQSAKNRRSTRLITHDGTTDSLTGWSRRLGIAKSTLFNRLNRGWSVQRAFTEPVDDRYSH